MSQNLLEKLQDIREELTDKEVKTAVKSLLHFIKNDYGNREHQNDVTALSSRYTAARRDKRNNVIDHNEFVKESSNVTMGILEIITQIEEDLEQAKTPENPVGISNIEPQNIELRSNLPTPQAENPQPATTSIEVENLVESTPHEDPKIVLQAQNLLKQYGRKGFKLEAKKVELPLSTITALVGENATGKTTLIKMLAGELAINKGKITYPLLQKGGGLNWAKIKQQIAYIPQHLPPWNKSLYESLCFEAVTHAIPAGEIENEVQYIIHRLGLSEYIHHDWQQLSGGYKLRYALAKALIWQPQLLIIDEPMAHLDIRAQLIVLQDLKKIASSQKYPIAILLSSQHIHEIEHIADKILFMQDGQVENCDTHNAGSPHHYFELSCDLSKEELKNHLSRLSCTRMQYTGMSYILTTDKSVDALTVQQYFSKENIPLHFFRDISKSIKTKFYEHPTA